MNTHARGILSAVFLGVVSCGALAQQTPAPSIPHDPIASILEAFRTHDLVALGEGNHNNEQSHHFRIALIRDARFAATVNDIVVESGNARYQDVMDRFVGGADVPDEILRNVWQNTTQASWEPRISRSSCLRRRCESR